MERVAARMAGDPLIGSVLHERYRVLRRIGRGGMGIVYLAEHVLIGRKYALKILSERANATDEMVARFHREAVAAAAVGSDHVVEVTDMGRLEDGTSFIVMEYLDGVELASAVFSDGPFVPGRAVKVACQLCDALTAVHETGIVHRDLKPENLFLISHASNPDFLKVLDFGVCKLLEGAPDPDPQQPPLTRTNASLGTPQYMAPEQFQNSASVDHRADIHAVGAILYFMLTGKPPFDAPTMGQLFMRVCVEPPPALLAQRPDLPPALDSVIRRAMSKHPEDRFASGAALKAALLPFTELRGGEIPAGVTLPIAVTPPVQCPTRKDAPGTAPGVVLSRYSWLPPRSRWLRPMLASCLLLGLTVSMALAAGALGASETHRPKPAASQADSPRKLREEQLARPVQDPAPALGAQPASTTPATPPQVPKPRLQPARARAATHNVDSEASAAPEPVVPEPAAPLPARPAPSAPPADSGAEYRFPRRALKDVF